MVTSHNKTQENELSLASSAGKPNSNPKEKNKWTIHQSQSEQGFDSYVKRLFPNEDCTKNIGLEEKFCKKI